MVAKWWSSNSVILSIFTSYLAVLEYKQVNKNKSSFFFISLFIFFSVNMNSGLSYSVYYYILPWMIILMLNFPSVLTDGNSFKVALVTFSDGSLSDFFFLHKKLLQNQCLLSQPQALDQLLLPPNPVSCKRGSTFGNRCGHSVCLVIFDCKMSCLFEKGFLKICGGLEERCILPERLGVDFC